MEGNYLGILSSVAKNFIPDGTPSCQRIFSKLDLKLALVCEIQLCQLLLHDFIFPVEFGQGEGLYIKSRYKEDINMLNRQDIYSIVYLKILYYGCEEGGVLT